jgi:hypothetical protein
MLWFCFSAIGSLAVTLIITLFQIGPAKVLPRPTGSHISNQFFAHRFLIAPMMKAVSPFEKSVTFYQVTWSKNPEDSRL